jgi:hypothetical protein
MKRFAVLAALLLAVTQIQAQSQPAAKAADVAPAAVKPADPKAVPTAKPVEKKKEAEPIIPGLTIPRGNGTFLGLEVAGGNFKLSFYDKKKKPVAPDVSRATARWPNLKSVTGPNRTVLNPSGKSLVGSKPVLAPYSFNVYISLMQGDGDDAKVVETYDVPFRG